MRTKCNEKRMVAIEMGTHTTHLSNGNVDQMAFEHIVFLILILLLFIVHQARRSNFLLSLDDKMFLLFYFIFFFFVFICSIVFGRVLVLVECSMFDAKNT